MGIAKRAVENFDLQAAKGALIQFGWGNDSPGRDAKWNNLDELARKALARRLVTPVQRTMRRWERGGYFKPEGSSAGPARMAASI